MVVPEPARVPRPVWSDINARAKISGARRRVLEVVESAATPMTAAEIGAELALHHNTVREHLDALVEIGFVTVSSQATGRRGRPALRYAALTADPYQVLSSYVSLLNSVADTLDDGPGAEEVALEIGRRWAERTEVEHPEVRGASGAAPAGDTAPALIEDLVPELARLGFDPKRDGTDLVLRSCPLVTDGRPPHPLVCVMHAGFLEALAQRRGGRTALRLEPLVGPGCRIAS